MTPADKDPFKKIFHKKNNEKFEFLFAGDLSFGENYQQRIKEQGGESILESQGYDYGLEKLKPLMTNADFVVVNLETPITDLKKSPFAEQKSYIHWTDTEKTPKALIDHNVSLVSLANNHSFDYGQEGYDQTMQILKKYDLPVIGAGDNIDKASQPYICEINFEDKKIKIAIIAAFEEVRSYRNKYKVYAENKKSGLMPLDMDYVANQVKEIKAVDPETFIIFFPHWGDNYKWCDQEQITLSNSLFSCGVDLIIGHGAHMMQEFEQHHGKLVLYNIGNFMFHSPGRYQKMQAPPYSAAVSLTVKLVNNQFDIGLKLYPIVSDNKITNYQPRMANKTELEDLLKALSQRKIMQSSSYLLETQKDQFGYYFEFSNLKERFIGMIYHHKYETQIKTDKFVLLPQILVITNEFKKHNYKLVCYSPTNVNKIDNTVTGYILENTPTNHILGKNNFKQICTSIPNVNHDFYFGSDNLNHYRDFMSWALNHKYKIYPTKAITKLTQDKLLTAQVLSKFNKSIIPYTESFNGNIAQLQKYLQQNSAVFIKPRYGRMGNNIFVVRSKNELFIAEYYLRQEKTITSFATLKTCLAHVNKVIDEEYIIQEAIDVMQYDNQVFAIRAIAFNTGQKWLCLTEVRISNKSNAVSNGGSFEVTLDFLLKILPQKEAVAILEKIKKDTIDLTMKINSEYDDTIVELAFDVLVDKKGNIYIAEINIKPGLTGINLDNDFFNMNDYEKYLYKELAVRQGEYLAKALLYKDSNKSFQNSITSISDKQLSSYQKSIGMLYHEHHNTKMNQGKFNIILHRASVLAPELAKYNYKLILYSPINVDKETNIVAGYIWEDNEFKPTLTTLPKINHDFYIGPDDLNSYRPFQPWAKERGYKLYPTRPLRILTQNKLLSAEILAEFNSSVVPYTERFRGTEEQLQKYLAKTPIVFIKPQFGSMGNKIFVVKSKNDKFIAEYYLQQKKTVTSFLGLAECITHINKMVKDEKYIIQEAVDVARYKGGVFDIRAIVFNEGQSWHFLSEVRISDKGSEVSNGGSTDIPIEFLAKIFSQERAPKILEKIRRTTINLTMLLNKKYDNAINELAFDILIDKAENIYIAEINTKPGLAGVERYEDFFNMNDYEKNFYGNLSIKHGHYLARSLIYRDSLDG